MFMHVLWMTPADTFPVPKLFSDIPACLIRRSEAFPVLILSSSPQAHLIMADTSSVLPRPSTSQASNSISPSALHPPSRADVLQYIYTVGSLPARITAGFGCFMVVNFQRVALFLHIPEDVKLRSVFISRNSMESNIPCSIAWET